MTHRVVILRRAERDLREIGQYVARDSPAASARLVGGMLDAIEQLAELPMRGAAPVDSRLAAAGYRYLVHGSYLIFYKVVGRRVRICRVLHGRRAWWTLLR